MRELKAQDLRPTNLIEKDGVVKEFSIYDYPVMLNSPERYKHIPLTEEWLVKFGIKNSEVTKIGYENSGEIYISFRRAAPVVFISDERDNNYSFGVKCKYVHQLQNLYFALTGEELTIKDHEQF